MSNPELVSYYLSAPVAPNKIPIPTTDNILLLLEDYCQGDWTWELINEILVMDSTMVCTTVMLYVPGRILTGRATCPVKDIQTNHLRALIDAAKMITSSELQNVGSQTKTLLSVPSNADHNMTIEQIQNAINADQQSSVKNVESSVKKENKVEAKQPSNIPSDYDAPQERYKGFSQHQMDRMADFKKRAEVIDDNSLRNYIHMWNPNFYHKGHLTPQNIDEFFDWYDGLEQTGC